MKPILTGTVLAVLVMVLGCASQQYMPKADEPIYGTWENEDYLAHTSEFWSESQQVVIRPGGECEMSRLLGQADVGSKMDIVYSITSKWADDAGAIWYQQLWTAYFEYGGKLQEHSRFYVLSRISDSGKKLELIKASDDYPAEMDSESVEYRVFYRKD